MSMWNTVPMRPLTTHKPFNPWGVAALTYLLGMAVILGIGFVIGTLGFLLMSGMWFAGAGEGPYPADLVVVVVAVALGIGVLSLAIQSRFISRRGGARPVVAPVAALAGSLLVGLAVTPADLPEPALVALQAVVEIVVLAKLIDPKR
jgi:hypothetical protein